MNARSKRTSARALMVVLAIILVAACGQRASPKQQSSPPPQSPSTPSSGVTQQGASPPSHPQPAVPSLKPVLASDETLFLARTLSLREKLNSAKGPEDARFGELLDANASDLAQLPEAVETVNEFLHTLIQGKAIDSFLSLRNNAVLKQELKESSIKAVSIDTVRLLGSHKVRVDTYPWELGFVARLFGNHQDFLIQVYLLKSNSSAKWEIQDLRLSPPLSETDDQQYIAMITDEIRSYLVQRGFIEIWPSR